MGDGGGGGLKRILLERFILTVSLPVPHRPNEKALGFSQTRGDSPSVGKRVVVAYHNLPAQLCPTIQDWSACRPPSHWLSSCRICKQRNFFKHYSKCNFRKIFVESSLRSPSWPNQLRGWTVMFCLSKHDRKHNWFKMNKRCLLAWQSDYCTK